MVITVIMHLSNNSDFLEIPIDTVLSDDERRLLDSFLTSLLKGKDLKNRELKLSLVDKDVDYIPSSIFSKELGMTETVVKFLKENKKLGFAEISDIIKRSYNTAAVSYNKAKGKVPKQFTDLDYTVKIPFGIFKKRWTALESICVYLKEKLDMKYSEIARTLDRNDRTIWTVYNRVRDGGGRK